MCYGILGWSATNAVHKKCDIGVAELDNRQENMFKNWRYLFMKIILSSVFFLL